MESQKTLCRGLDSLLTDQIASRSLTIWAEVQVGISARELHRIRRGVVKPGPLTIALLARALGVTPRKVAKACGVEWSSVARAIKAIGIS